MKILTEFRDRVALLTLNAPEKRNALDKEMVEEMHRALDGMRERDGLQAVVVTGAGDKAFAGGADIAELRDRRAAQALQAINSSLFNKIEEFPVPVIAAVRGFALGGGCELAIACDLRVAGRSARFGQPEVKLGIIPAAGATYRLPRLIGLGRARELIYTGRMVDAEEALRIGLVNRLVDDAEVLSAALALAAEISANGPLAVRLAKVATNALDRPGHAAAIALESAAQAILFDSADKMARMTGFLDKTRARPQD